MSFVVTIDGPAAAGKSTTARALARRLGIQFLDTGAFYRALALKALEEGLDTTDGEALRAMVARTRIETRGAASQSSVWLDGRDVTQLIRTPDVSEAASQVAAVAAVRRVLVEWQRTMRASGPLVGEGRDLGTVVFPDAEVKIFLDADLETRARRRYRELESRGLALSIAEVRADLARRDQRDRNRQASPLEAADDAVHVDTSGMTLEEQVDAVLAVVRRHPDCPVVPSER